MVVHAFRGTLFWAMVLGIIVVLLSFDSAGAASDDDVEDVENFSYASWDVSYDLSLDEQDRAHAEVTEVLEAQFPETDQNRGIVRALPLQYQSAPAAPDNITVTDEAGDEVPFEVDDGDGFRSILVGDDSFVHGSQTYAISYTVADVMHATETADEFYWDLVPVDRQQPINEVTAEINLDSQLSAAFTGSSACYRGTPDQTQSCSIEEPSNGDSVFRVSESQLASGEGLTVAIGVDPGTVTQPPEREENFVLDGMPILLVSASGLLALGGAVAVLVMIRRYRDDTSQVDVQYGLPEAMNPLMAKWVTGRGEHPVVATILDLAVRGVLRIEESEDTSGRRTKKPKPVLRLLEPDLATDPLETQLLEGLFGSLEPGRTFDFPKNSKSFTKAAQRVLNDSGKAALERGYQTKVRHRGATYAGLVAAVLLIPVVVLLIMGAARDNTLTAAISVTVGLLSLMLSYICLMKHRVLTPRGAAERAQLEWLRHMMKVSEADRLAMRQSVTSASRQPTPNDTRGETIRLYDQLLPYAVLFGMQQDWAKVLASTYQHHHLPAPIWYPALWDYGADGAQDSLSTMLSSVSSAATTSSSGAGSTGGGAAGAGGGGGAAGGR